MKEAAGFSNHLGSENNLDNNNNKKKKKVD
jgi:hypothetical protein